MADRAPKVIAALPSEVLPLLELASADDVQRIGLKQLIAGCDCALVDVEGGRFALALMRMGVELWIQAAGGKGQGMTLEGLPVVEQIARQNGLESVGFQTRRPGLVKLARRAGYEIDAFVLRKKLC